MSSSKTLTLVTAIAGLGLMATAQIASATHPRPKGATPIVASLVPAYDACAAPNRTHGPPLAFPSCGPPVQSSTAITVGSPDANGAPANSVGSIRIAVIVGTPGAPDDSDVKLLANITDVRCKAGTASCGPANAADGADYTGEVQATAEIRITDHYNAAAAGGGTDPATVVDIPFPVDVPCSATASTSIGSTCAVNTTANSVVPAAVKDTKRANVSVNGRGQAESWGRVIDGGSDGVVATTPNTLFEVQGIFIP